MKKTPDKKISFHKKNITVIFTLVIVLAGCFFVIKNNFNSSALAADQSVYNGEGGSSTFVIEGSRVVNNRATNIYEDVNTGRWVTSEVWTGASAAQLCKEKSGGAYNVLVSYVESLVCYGNCPGTYWDNPSSKWIFYDGGGYGDGRAIIQVTCGRTNQPPTGVLNSDNVYFVNVPQKFDASASTDSDGWITSYAYNYDGTWWDSGTVNFHTYTDHGMHSAYLKLIDNSGNVSIVSKEITSAEILQVDINGSGTVMRSDPGTACDGTKCPASSFYYPRGTNVTLTAYPNSGSSFLGYGAIGAQSSPYTIIMDSSKTIKAFFGQLSWRVGEWSTCVGGYQSRDVYCATESNLVADDSLCLQPKPSTSQTCPPTASISALSNSISQNQATTISWSASNATYCNVTPNNWTGTTGTQSTGNLTSTTTYTLQCTGPGGSVSKSVTVYVGVPPPPSGVVSVDFTPACDGLGGGYTLYGPSSFLQHYTSSVTLTNMPVGQYYVLMDALSSGWHGFLPIGAVDDLHMGSDIVYKNLTSSGDISFKAWYPSLTINLTASDLGTYNIVSSGVHGVESVGGRGNFSRCGHLGMYGLNPDPLSGYQAKITPEASQVQNQPGGVINWALEWTSSYTYSWVTDAWGVCTQSGDYLQTRTCNNPAPLYGGAECQRIDSTLTTPTNRDETRICTPAAAASNLIFSTSLQRGNQTLTGVNGGGITVLQNGNNYDICTDKTKCNIPVRAGDDVILDFWLVDEDGSIFTNGSSYNQICTLTNPDTGAKTTCSSTLNTTVINNKQKTIIHLVESGIIELKISGTGSGNTYTKTVTIRVPRIGSLQ